MTKTEPSTKSKSTSSEQMDNSERSNAILELGRKLVHELQLEQTNDTLGRWMAHYIAELITKADNADSKGKKQVQKECFDTILKLWEHRHEMPDGKRPFEDLEPIIRAIGNLDPDGGTYRYFRSAQSSRTMDKENPQTVLWLELSDDIDHSAKLLIRHCLKLAAQTAVDNSEEWVTLAEKASVPDEQASWLLQFASDDKREAKQCRRLEKRLGRLEKTIEIANTVAQGLKANIDSLSRENGNGNADES